MTNIVNFHEQKAIRLEDQIQDLEFIRFLHIVNCCSVVDISEEIRLISEQADREWVKSKEVG